MYNKMVTKVKKNINNGKRFMEASNDSIGLSSQTSKYHNLNKNDKQLLFLITIILDIYLLLLYFDDTHRLLPRDKSYIKIILIIHGFFYFVLYNNFNDFLPLLHLSMMILLMYGLISESIQIQFAILGLVTVIQILWVYKEKCIMMPRKKSNPTNQNLGFNRHFSTFTILYTIVLSLRLGYRFAYDAHADS